MPELLALGISHKTAPVALRERVALTEGRAAGLLRSLVADGPVSEAVAVSTCNRTELYLVVEDAARAEAEALGELARQADIPPAELAGRLYTLRADAAIRHLFEVTAGLDSVVLGEAEIQGQVRRAYELALVEGATGPLLNRLFQAALGTGGRVRSETRIGAGGVSVSSVAVAMAAEALADLNGSRVLLVGAGDTAERVARALTSRGAAVAFVANRHRDRAEALAREHGGEAIGMDELPARLAEADLVIAATHSPHHVIEPEDLQQRHPHRGDLPLVLIDLAVPRDINPACAEAQQVTLLDIDDLQAAVERNADGRAAGLDPARAIVQEEVARFREWLETLRVAPTVAALQRRADRIVREVLDENRSRWQGLTPADGERLEKLAAAVTKRLLHEPIRRLKEGDEAEAQLQAAVLHDLFELKAVD